MFKLFSPAGREFAGTQEELKQRVGQVASTNDTRPGTAIALRPADRTQTYRDIAPAAARPLGVADLMSRQPVTLTTLQDITTAWQLMQQHDIAQLPILQPPQRLVGLLTREEVLKCLVIRDERIGFVSSQRITDLMQQPVIAVEANDDIRQVALLLLDEGLNAAPVVDQRDQLIGIISRSDILGFLASTRPVALRT